MKAKTKKSLFRNFLQFIRLQIAGNILFWATYVGYAFADNVLHIHSWQAVAVPSILAHGLFFLVDRNWVFSDKTGKRKTSGEIVRFVLFMGLNYFINLGIVLGLQQYFGITPYVGQLIAGVFFTVWTWAGLKFWVFRVARHARHHGFTIEIRNTHEKRHSNYKHLETKQKAKRATRLHR
jgi:putative flippase GtrA